MHYREILIIHERPVGANDSIEIREGVRIVRRTFQQVEADDHPAADHLAKQRFLVREVEIDGALRDAGEPGDVFEPRFVEPIGGEGGEGGGDDLGFALLGRSPGSRFRLVGGLVYCD